MMAFSSLVSIFGVDFRPFIPCLRFVVVKWKLARSRTLSPLVMPGSVYKCSDSAS